MIETFALRPGDVVLTQDSPVARKRVHRLAVGRQGTPRTVARTVRSEIGPWRTTTYDVEFTDGSSALGIRRTSIWITPS